MRQGFDVLVRLSHGRCGDNCRLGSAAWHTRYGSGCGGRGGLPKVRITSSRTIGEMYLHGAQVTDGKTPEEAAKDGKIHIEGAR